jgi:hypothetical protein
VYPERSAAPALHHPKKATLSAVIFIIGTELGDSGSGKSLRKSVGDHVGVSLVNDVDDALHDGLIDTIISNA